jgi:DNA-binding beta-propeller fold protein YncE
MIPLGSTYEALGRGSSARSKSQKRRKVGETDGIETLSAGHSSSGVLASSVLRAGSAPSSKALLVLAKRDRTLAIVDPSTLKVVARVPVGPDRQEVIADSDGKFAYASNYGGRAYHTLADRPETECRLLTPALAQKRSRSCV